MIVSMIQFIIHIPYAGSLKDKRKVVKSIKEKLISRYRLSAAEVDLLDSCQYAQIGAALVSNSKEFGESVLNKVLSFVEDNYDARLMDFQILSEQF